MPDDEIVAYHGDDGLASIRPVVGDPATDFGTALLISWRLEGPWLRRDSAACHRKVAELCRVLEQRLVRGFYARRAIPYDLVADHQLSGVQVHKLRQAGVPARVAPTAGTRRGAAADRLRCPTRG